MNTPEQAGAVEIAMLARDAGAGTAAEITELVNRVYAATEKGIWLAGAQRTTLAETAEFVRRGQLAAARLAGRVVGCIRVQRLDDGVGEFGMLAADPAHQGIGIGRRLIEFAERLICEEGRETMQLELLVPKAWTHPNKKLLHEWYTRLGYRIVRTGDIDEQYPALAPLLATPCDFVVYHKRLG